MKVNEITEKREDTLQVFCVFIVIAGIVGGIVGIVTAVNENDYIYAVYGIASFLTAYLIFSILTTLAENHCMLRNILEERIGKINANQENADEMQKVYEEKNEKNLQK